MSTSDTRLFNAREHSVDALAFPSSRRHYYEVDATGGPDCNSCYEGRSSFLPNRKHGYLSGDVIVLEELGGCTRLPEAQHTRDSITNVLISVISTQQVQRVTKP